MVAEHRCLPTLRYRSLLPVPPLFAGLAFDPKEYFLFLEKCEVEERLILERS
jgi:hypothetical protein